MKINFGGVIEDIKSNETVKAVTDKVEDVVEQLTSNETVQQAGEFVKEQGERAGQFLKESAESIGQSDFFKKLKDIAGVK